MNRRGAQMITVLMLLVGLAVGFFVSSWYAVAFVAGGMYTTLFITAALIGWPTRKETR